MTDLLSDIETPSDGELISRVRGGDAAAYGELFSRHVEAARRLARQLARGADADDLVADAFAKVLQILQNGGGPDVAFRAYLLTSVRRLHVDRIRAGSRLQTSDDMTQFDPGVPFQDTAVAGFEHGAAAKAFASLPERWQLVLWHLEVEGQKPADIAPLLGMSANSVSALAYRAREGLRQAFLTMHLADISVEQCRWVNEHLGAYVRKGLSRRDTAKVEEHLDECRRCMGVYLELTEVNSNLAGIIAPLLLGGIAAGYLSSSGAAGATGLTAVFGRVRDAVAGHASVATAGAVAAGVVTAVSVGVVIARSPDNDVVTGADDPVSVVQTPSGALAPHRTSRDGSPTDAGRGARPAGVGGAGIAGAGYTGDDPLAAPTAAPTGPADAADGPPGGTTDPAGDPDGDPDGGSNDQPRGDSGDNPGGDPSQEPTGDPTGSATSEPTGTETPAPTPTATSTGTPTPTPTEDPTEDPTDPGDGPLPLFPVDLSLTGLEVVGSDLVLSVGGVPTESVTVSVDLGSSDTTFASTGTDCLAGARHAECVVPAASLTAQMMAMILPTNGHQFRIPLSYPDGMESDTLSVSVDLLAEGVVYDETDPSDNTATYTFEPTAPSGDPTGDPGGDPGGDPSTDPSPDPGEDPTVTPTPSGTPDPTTSADLALEAAFVSAVDISTGHEAELAVTVLGARAGDTLVFALDANGPVEFVPPSGCAVNGPEATCAVSADGVFTATFTVDVPPGQLDKTTLSVTAEDNADPNPGNNTDITISDRSGTTSNPVVPSSPVAGSSNDDARGGRTPYDLRTALTETSSHRPVEHREPPDLLRGWSPFR